MLTRHSHAPIGQSGIVSKTQLTSGYREVETVWQFG
jgi:hypothetical protein